MDMLGGDGEGGSSTLNPLAAIGASLAAGAVEGASDDVRDEDTNVVVATLPHEQQLIGKVLSGASGRPSIVYRVWQALLLLSAAWAVTGGTRVDAAWAGMAEPNQLILVAKAFTAVGRLWLLVVLEATRIALQPVGFLHELGAGEVKISASEARALGRWRGFIRVVSGLATAMSLFTCWFALFAEFPYIMPPHSGAATPTEVRIHVLVSAVWLFTGGAIMCLGLWSSMMLASSLVRDASLEVIGAVRTSSPLEAEVWRKSVEEPAILLDDTFCTLSAGWGTGLLGMAMAAWSYALTRLCDAINEPRSIGLARENVDDPQGWQLNALLTMAAISLIPVFLAHDIAETSTCADTLMDTLNAARIKHGKECDDAVSWLEKSLRKLNRGQGLGFAVGGSVLDRKTLRTLAITLMGGLTTLITMLTALGDAHDGFHGDGADAACELSSMEKDVLRRLLANNTCAFNDFEAFNRSFASYLR